MEIQNKSKEGVDIETVYKFKDGYSFVKLLSQEEYTKEGDVMGHCVGRYHGRNGIVIYSLRDPKGESHATLEVRIPLFSSASPGKGDVHQIKGKQNDKPVEKYIPYIKEFILNKDFDVLNDGENIGMLIFKRQYYFEDSKQWLQIYKEEIIPYKNGIFKKIKSNIKNNIHKGDINISFLYLKKLPSFLNSIILNGNFYCHNNQLTTLENSPKKVNGVFDCFENQLTTLEGSPKEVNGFDCHNNQLTTLEGGPKIVNGAFHCYNNQLRTLEGSPEIVNGFNCSNNQLTTLEGGPKEVNGYFYCFNNLVILQKPKNSIIQGVFNNGSHNV